MQPLLFNIIILTLPQGFKFYGLMDLSLNELSPIIEGQVSLTDTHTLKKQLNITRTSELKFIFLKNNNRKK